MSQVEQRVLQGDENEMSANDTPSGADRLFVDPVIANDDEKHSGMVPLHESPEASGWQRITSYSQVFAGAFMTLVAGTAASLFVESGAGLSIGNIAMIATVAVGLFWLITLIIQNNSLLAAYHKSEVTRLRPDAIAAASRELAQEVDIMERKIGTYTTEVTKSITMIRHESGNLNSEFVTGAAEIRDVLERFAHARSDMTSKLNDIKVTIEAVETSIKNSVTQFPVETQRNADAIVKTFSEQMDGLITKMKAELAADEKFALLANSLKVIETGIETLFTAFEQQLTAKIDLVKPVLIETAANTAQNIQASMVQSSEQVKSHLDRISSDIQSENVAFFEKFPVIMTEFKTETGQVSRALSDSISEASRNVIGTLNSERLQFETDYKAAMQSLSDFVKQVSKEIKDTTDLLEQDFDAFLGKFNFNFIGKLNFFSELVESKTHHFSDRMLEEIDLLKRNFAELANSFSQIIESSMVSFDRRSEYMTVEIENHLSGIISKSLANIATRLDLFEEQVSSRINKMNTAIGGDTSLSRRPFQQSRFNNDYLSILEQQMNDIHQSLYELKQGSSTLTRK